MQTKATTGTDETAHVLTDWEELVPCRLDIIPAGWSPSGLGR